MQCVLWLVRHGKTILNTVERVQGWIDSPLTTAGTVVVQRLATGLKGINFDAIYSSDSGRAIETAKIIRSQQKNQQKIHLLPSLREACFGSYEGELDVLMKNDLVEFLALTPEERQASGSPSNFLNPLAQLEQQRRVKFENHCQLPPADNFNTLKERLFIALDTIDQQAVEQQWTNVLIVTHGVSIWTIWEVINQLEGYDGQGIANASVMKIHKQVNGQWEILTANDLSYQE